MYNGKQDKSIDDRFKNMETRLEMMIKANSIDIDDEYDEAYVPIKTGATIKIDENVKLYAEKNFNGNILAALEDIREYIEESISVDYDFNADVRYCLMDNLKDDFKDMDCY